MKDSSLLCFESSDATTCRKNQCLRGFRCVGHLPDMVSWLASCYHHKDSPSPIAQGPHTGTLDNALQPKCAGY